MIAAFGLWLMGQSVVIRVVRFLEECGAVIRAAAEWFRDVFGACDLTTFLPTFAGTRATSIFACWAIWSGRSVRGFVLFETGLYLFASVTY